MLYCFEDKELALNTFSDFTTELKSQLQELGQRSEVLFEDNGTITAFYLGYRFSPKHNVEVEPRLELVQGYKGIELLIGGLYDKEGVCLDDNELRLTTNKGKNIVFKYSADKNSDFISSDTYKDSLRHIVSLVTLHYQELLF